MPTLKKPMPPRYIAVPFTGGGPILPIPDPVLSASPVTGSQINLSVAYTGPPGATSYAFEQSSSGTGPFVPLSSGTSSTYQDQGLSSATTYFFRARVQVADGRFSNFSAVKSATTLASAPLAPTGVSATDIDDHNISISWASSAGATSYNLYRNGVLVTVGVTSPTIDSGLNASTTYIYQVTAVNSTGESGLSSSDSATTTASPAGTLKFHPGFFGVFDTAGGASVSHFNGGDSGIINGTTTNVTLGNPPDNLMGFGFIIDWIAIDVGTSSPSYDWTVVDLYANAIRAKKKQWWLWIRHDHFVGGPTSSISNGARCVPTWLLNQQGAFGTMANYNTLGKGCFPKMYKTAVFNAYTDFWRAVAARYDSDPFFEGIAHGIGTSTPQFNGLDDLGTRQPNINYNTDYSDAAMISAYKNLMVQGRQAFPTSNVWLTTDYMFNAGDNDANWIGMFDSAIANKVALGGPDSWTNKWLYPQIPFSSTGQNCTAPRTNTSFNRGIYGDQIYRGWRGPTPGVGTGYRNRVLYCGCQELTEMGGYIGQFAPDDVWLGKGPNLDNVPYMFFDVNYGGTGNYGLNNAPNTLWTSSSSYNNTLDPDTHVPYGNPVYTFIQGAGPTNHTNPYT